MQVFSGMNRPFAGHLRRVLKSNATVHSSVHFNKRWTSSSPSKQCTCVQLHERIRAINQLKYAREANLGAKARFEVLWAQKNTQEIFLSASWILTTQT
jgi:glycerol-3-phosphate cytidylyltransferase-like family protein